MNTTKTQHVFPTDHYVELEFVSNEEGMFDDKSIGFISATDIAGDECHLPNVKSSAIVKFFADFIQIENVLREAEHGNRASADTMNDLRIIKKQLDKWLEIQKEEK